MAKKDPAAAPSPIPRAFATTAEIDVGVRKLQRRIEQAERLVAADITVDSPQVETATSDIRSTILDVFGPTSPEFMEHQYHDIWHGQAFAGMSFAQRNTCFQDGVPRSIAVLRGLVERLQEKRDDLAFVSPEGTFRSNVSG